LFMILRTPKSTLFPYTTLFRSSSKSQRSVSDSEAAMGMGCTRVLDRVAAALGGLEAAPVEFEAVADVPSGGVLWALPALLANGLLRQSRKCFQLPKGFYSVVNIFLLLAFMSLGCLQ